MVRCTFIYLENYQIREQLNLHVDAEYAKLSTLLLRGIQDSWAVLCTEKNIQINLKRPYKNR